MQERRNDHKVTWDTEGTQGPWASRQRRRLRSGQTGPVCREPQRQKAPPWCFMVLYGDTSDYRPPWLRLERQAQDKAQDKGTGPQGPVMDALRQQRLCHRDVKGCQHSCKIKNKT